VYVGDVSFSRLSLSYGGGAELYLPRVDVCRGGGGARCPKNSMSAYSRDWADWVYVGGGKVGNPVGGESVDAESSLPDMPWECVGSGKGLENEGRERGIVGSGS
jgi:hypothetical protein